MEGDAKLLGFEEEFRLEVSEWYTCYGFEDLVKSTQVNSFSIWVLQNKFGNVTDGGVFFTLHVTTFCTCCWFIWVVKFNFRVTFETCVVILEVGKTYSLNVFPALGGGGADCCCWFFSHSITDVLCRLNLGASIACLKNHNAGR